jgi:hypothetical protein
MKGAGGAAMDCDIALAMRGGHVFPPFIMKH